MSEGNDSPRRHLRRLRRLILIGLPALLGLLLIGAALAISDKGDSLPMPQGLGSLREEVTRVLSTAEGASRLRIDEASLTRLGAAALKETTESSDGSFEVLGFAAGADAGYLSGNLAFELALPGTMLARGLRTTAALGLAVESGENALLLTPTKLRLGRLPLPPFIVAATYQRIVPQDAPGRSAVQLTKGTFAVPFDLLNQSIPKLVALTSVQAVSEGVDLFFEADSATALSLLTESAPLLNRILPALATVLSESGIDVEQEVEELLVVAAAPEGPEVAPLPTALVSYLQNEVEVLFEDSRFVPEIGEDLFAPSSVQTGSRSATELLLRDRSVVRIAEETQFELTILPSKSSGSTEINLQSGSLRAKVNKIVSDEDRFSLRVGSAILGVRGTDLFVRIEPEGGAHCGGSDRKCGSSARERGRDGDRR